jgi:mycoredoxin
MVAQPLPVTIYINPRCRMALRARDRLRNLNVPFTEINILEDEAAAQHLERLANGFRSTPTIVFGDEEIVLVEPTMSKLEETLRKAGYIV